MRTGIKSCIVLSAAAVLALMAVVLCCILHSWEQAAQTPPSPDTVSSSTRDDITASSEADSFPEVDWSYWQGINPDVIGWITVPGTTIDSPIVQDPKDAPDYYLSHDVYRNYNIYGAIHLDAECADDGLASRNAVLLGHHAENLSAAPFGVIQKYVDASFAVDHAIVLLQTPDWQRTYKVRFSQIISGLEPAKRTTFMDDKDFRDWYDGMKSAAAMTLDAITEPEQTLSLVSCSYYLHPDNERTVVVASETEGQVQ